MNMKLHLPVPLRALGEEVRALNKFMEQGLITQEEASERIEDWQLFYPPGWHDIEMLVYARRQPLTECEAFASEFAEAAE